MFMCSDICSINSATPNKSELELVSVDRPESRRRRAGKYITSTHEGREKSSGASIDSSALQRGP